MCQSNWYIYKYTFLQFQNSLQSRKKALAAGAGVFANEDSDSACWSPSSAVDSTEFDSEAMSDSGATLPVPVAIAPRPCTSCDVLDRSIMDCCPSVAPGPGRSVAPDPSVTVSPGQSVAPDPSMAPGLELVYADIVHPGTTVLGTDPSTQADKLFPGKPYYKYKFFK